MTTIEIADEAKKRLLEALQPAQSRWAMLIVGDETSVVALRMMQPTRDGRFEGVDGELKPKAMIVVLEALIQTIRAKLETLS